MTVLAKQAPLITDHSQLMLTILETKDAQLMFPRGRLIKTWMREGPPLDRVHFQV